MGSDVGQIFPTASLHRDHSISYAMVCEKKISDILSWDRKSYPCYLTQVGTWGLNNGCTGIHAHGCMTSMFSQMTSCDIVFQRIQGLLWAYFNLKSKWWARKKNPFLCEGGIDRKIRPSDSPFVITRQDLRCQTKIIGTDFSISPTHSWGILIIL